MEARLARTIMDKVSAASFLVAITIAFIISHNNLDTSETIVLALFFMACLINVFFIYLTPIAVIKDSNLFLYSEVQPIIINIKPQVVNLDTLTKVEISKKLLEYRAIFTFNHNSKVYHAFPATRTKRIKYLFDFLKSNIELEVIKSFKTENT